MRMDVVTFGSAVVDVFVDTDMSEKKGNLVYPVGAKILLKDLKYDIGGGGTNTAVAFSRLGLKTGCICKIGKDNNGKEIIQMLKKEKVKFLGKIEKGKVSGYSIILDSKQHNRTILTYKGINNEISLKDVKARRLRTKWLYLTSLLSQSFKTQVKLARLIKNRGGKIAYNPSEYIIRKYKKRLFPLLKLCDVVILNKQEAQLLTKNKNLLEGLRKLGPKIVVITDKNKKVVSYDGIKKYFIIPHKIKVIERTGAGDAFASGFVAGLVVNKSIPESLELGLKEGESVLRHFGAKNKLLRMKLK